MSALYRVAASSPSPESLRFARMKVDDLPEVLTIENDVYPHPWTRGNFLDSLYNGYECWALREEDGALAGYFLLMLAVDESHLLNISVRRSLHGHGVGRTMLDKAAAVSKENGMQSVLLEVRPSNERALKIYHEYGYVEIGRRKAYYPAQNNTREDAIVMRFQL